MTATDQAAVHIDFSAHSRADKLLEHHAWVQGERKAADRRREEGVRIWLLSGTSNLVLFGIVQRHDLDLNAHKAVVHNLAIEF